MKLEGECARLKEAELFNLFPVPFFAVQWPDNGAFQGELRSAILARRERGIGIRSSNFGGWHSERDLQDWPEPCVLRLLKCVQQAVQELVLRTEPDADERLLTGWGIEAWANVNGSGSRNASHDHSRGRTLWSGIYYVDPGEGNGAVQVSGLTKFEDRSGVPVVRRRNEGKGREHAVEPRAGLMVLFPGRLWHYVEPFHGPSLRITIAFNLRHPDFMIPTSGPELSRGMAFMWRNFRGIMWPAQQLRHKLGALRA